MSADKMNPDEFLADKFKQLYEKVQESEVERSRNLYPEVHLPFEGLGSMQVSFDDVETGIAKNKLLQEESDAKERKTLSVQAAAVDNVALEKQSLSPHMKIKLQVTENILLYEQRSVTELLDTEEGRRVHAENESYAQLLQRKDRDRHIRDAEAQTMRMLNKCRAVNTVGIAQAEASGYVSNFEMFDTYRELDQSTKQVQLTDKQQMQVTTYTRHGVDQCEQINRLPSFRLALMITMRTLAGNVFEPQQRRFRNMSMPDPLAARVRYLYRLELLWRNAAPPVTAVHGRKRAVSDMCWCTNNGDILAVAYGVYSYCQALSQLPEDGCVFIWNIKNPVNPERCYYFPVPVSAVNFSTVTPSLLAVGLHDGIVQVRDITHADNALVAVSQRGPTPSFEPIVALSWLPQTEDDSPNDRTQPILALSRDGVVTRYRLISGPHLLAHQQIQLQRIEGVPEGLRLSDGQRKTLSSQANQQPQGLQLALDVTQSDLYYVLTDEGCRYKCSTHYPQQYLEVRQLHAAAVNGIDYSPWSPRLFLSYGNDWCVRIWLEDILEPLLTLQHGMTPIMCAHWSRTHSTVLVALSRNAISVWDIRRSILKPMLVHSSDQCQFTLCKFTNCGRSLAVGTENGEVLMFALEDMPFPPHYQYKALKRALMAAIAIDTQLTSAVKSIGYFGFEVNRPQKKRKETKKVKKKLMNKEQQQQQQPEKEQENDNQRENKKAVNCLK